MRRGKFKVRSRNSMGILVLIVFLALIPIIICLTELREQHFIFQMICESIKEKPTGAGDVLGISILDTILSTISIAVSVWIGLNIYNVSVLLYRAEMKLGISERFQKGIVLSEITLDIIDEEDRLNIQNDIKHAYEWLNLAIKQVNPIINAYYNYSKACIYDSLFLGGGSQKMNEADKYLNTVEIIWNMNHSEKPKGYLYTRRNYWEANKEYDKALEINQVIMKVDNSGDARAAERVYDSKKRN